MNEYAPYALAVVFLLSANSLAQDEQQRIDFNRDVRPILSNHCYACHGPDQQQRQAGLRLDQREIATSALESGNHAIVPQQPDRSELIARVSSTDVASRMPPPDSGVKPLSNSQIETLKRWIEQGAEYQRHWAFIAPQRPAVPRFTQPQSWQQAAPMRNPIDSFIRRKLISEGLAPAPEADKVTLIRRVTLDLTGLPPTPAEVDEFLADTSPDAYENLVGRLLASPRYGEHMARYWLDAVRYGDTHGLHLDNYREIWPYRQWVIEAFNRNQPFDEFTIDQLAGDLRENPTDKQLIATGYVRSNVTTSEGGSIVEEVLVRNTVDRVETTAAVWLGLTAGCAVCHDHKFDPLTQNEFYQLYAFFNSTAEPALDQNAALFGPTLKILSVEQKRQVAALDARLKAHRGRQAEVEKVSSEEVAQWAQQWHKRLHQDGAPPEPTATSNNDKFYNEIVPILAKTVDQHSDDEQAKVREYYFHEVSEPWKSLQAQVEQYETQRKKINDDAPGTLIARELDKPRDAFVLKRGQYDMPQQQVKRAVPQWLPSLPGDAPVDRMGLAQWLVADDNPLIARVFINRLWQRLFGAGIVATSEDFGVQSEYPSHPQLLDWLAVEFRDSGWDVKHMVRLLVTSSTYRQQAAVVPQLASVDPDNRLLARGPRFRLDAEVIRDQALFVSGVLVEKFGGPSVKPYQPDGIWYAVGYTGSNTVRFKQDQGDALYRRSLYTFWKRTAPPPTMALMDAPTREAVCVRRPRTNTPLAALALMNDVQFFEAARHLAQRVLTEAGAETDERLVYLYRLVLARRPSDRELDVLRNQLDAHLARYSNDPEAAEKLLAVGESPRDEALSPTHHAAWTMLANLVLNLDEALNK